MKKLSLFLVLLLLAEFAIAQTSLSRRVISNKTSIGKSKLIRQADGGLMYVTGSGGNFYSGRLLPNGEVDDTYNGERTSKKYSNLINCRTLAVKQDKWGRYLIAGSSQLDSNSGMVATLVRLDKNGDPDAEFVPGIVQLKVGDSSRFIGVYVEPGERIIGIGTYYKNGRSGFFMTRLQYNGDKDKTFGNDGVNIDYSLLNDTRVLPTPIQAGNQYIVCGSLGEEGDNLFLLRYNSDGSLDTNYGSHGSAIINGNKSIEAKCLLQQGGKAIIAGVCAGELGGQDIFMMRFTPAGGIDTTFGKKGMVRIDVTANDRVDDIIMLPDGRFLLSGTGSDKSGKKYDRFLMLRFSQDGKEEKGYGYGSVQGLPPAHVGMGYTALANNIALSPIDAKVYRLSELVSSNETETTLTFATYLQDSALGIFDIPTGKLQNFVYPVPVSKGVTFSFDLVEDLELSVKLLDAGGKEVATVQSKKPYVEGENSITVNFPQSCKAGKYLVVLSSDAGYKMTVEVTKI